jgi:hypothetical protein
MERKARDLYWFDWRISDPSARCKISDCEVLDALDPDVRRFGVGFLAMRITYDKLILVGRCEVRFSKVRM